jgi:hypothetical protein
LSDLTRENVLTWNTCGWTKSKRERKRERERERGWMNARKTLICGDAHRLIIVGCTEKRERESIALIAA